MKRAYDLQYLLEQLKKEGLVAAEVEVKKVVDLVFAWVIQSASLSSTPYDDMAGLVLPKLKELIYNLADKISEDV